MSTVQNILNRTSVVADAARSTSTGSGFDAVLAGAIRDDRSATVDRRSQQPGREPVRAEQPDRTRTDRTDRTDRNSRPDRTDRPRAEKTDRTDRADRNRTDRAGQTDRPATTDGTASTDQQVTEATGDGTTAPTVTPVLVDPNTLVVVTPVEALPTPPVPTEATIAAESDVVAPVVVATELEVATDTDTAPTVPATTTAPVDEPATPQPATAQPATTQTTTVPTATAAPAEPVAPVAEPAVKPAPANAGPQPATVQAAPAAAQPTAQPTSPAPVESASPSPATPTTPTTPVGPAVQVGSVALPTTAVTRESAAPLSDQLAGKLAEQLPGLKAAGPGRHTLSLTVTPEHFGKIQVVAHISAESVRVELVGATDAARDSLRAALPDLRRDLAQSGLSSDVRLGDPNAGTDPRGGQPGLTDSGRRPTGTATPGGLPGEQATPSSESIPVRTASAAGGLDLLV